MGSRGKALLGVSALALSLIALFALLGYNQTWQLWNIPTMSPPFADLRVITHGADSAAKGLDPLISNPGDPWGRPLNYPRIWQSLYLAGINKSHTIALGTAIIACFLAGVILILPNPSNKTLALTMGALISPATLLGIERANIDLLIFFLVCIAIYAARKSATAASAIIILSTGLKLFPVFGLTLLLRLQKRDFARHASIALAALSTYIAAMWPELRLISKATPRATDLSYGINVAWMHMKNLDHSLGLLSLTASYGLIILAVYLAIIACRRSSASGLDDRTGAPFSLDSFRAGAGIYIGTFLLGNNWDYRLMFLILVIPQLHLWTTSTTREIRWCSKAAICVLFTSMWYLVISKLWAKLASGLILAFPTARLIPWLFDELSNWSLFLLLTYLFVLTLPKWAKDFARTQYRPTNRST